MKTRKYQKIKPLLSLIIILPFILISSAVMVAARAENSNFKQGIEYSRKGEYEKAAEKFKLVIREDRSNPDARLALGVVLINMKRPEEALPHVRRAAQLKPENKRALFILARIYEKMNYTERAIETWEEFLLLEPESRHKEKAQRHLKRLRKKR